MIAHIFEQIRLARLRLANPSCRIHRGARVDRGSRFCGKNVLFENVRVVDSCMGRHSYLQEGSLLFKTDVGNFCSLGMRAAIGLPGHALEYVSSHPAFFPEATPLVETFVAAVETACTHRTNVDHDVWIGHGAVVMQGVSLGTGCVIGAGAVVTKDVEPYMIVGGVPARSIRKRFPEDVCQGLLETRWWDLSDTQLRRCASSFQSADEFMRFWQQSGCNAFPENHS
jgi:acetyltransferase-like isoleucine patch superfamily enzyme